LLYVWSGLNQLPSPQTLSLWSKGKNELRCSMVVGSWLSRKSWSCGQCQEVLGFQAQLKHLTDSLASQTSGPVPRDVS
jgi:hypothetical protein